MKFNLLVGNEISLRQAKQIGKLDEFYFNSSYSLSIFKALFWFLKNRPGYIALSDENGIMIGYASIIAVKEKYFNQINNGEIYDVQTPLSGLIKLKKKGHYLGYFSGVVIHPKYQNSFAIIRLFNAFENLLNSLAEKGIFFDKISAVAVSENGKKLCEKTGLIFSKKINEKTFVYIRDFTQKFNENLDNKPVLFSKYKDTYFKCNLKN